MCTYVHAFEQIPMVYADTLEMWVIRVTSSHTILRDDYETQAQAIVLH